MLPSTAIVLSLITMASPAMAQDEAVKKKKTPVRLRAPRRGWLWPPRFRSADPEAARGRADRLGRSRRNAIGRVHAPYHTVHWNQDTDDTRVSIGDLNILGVQNDIDKLAKDAAREAINAALDRFYGVLLRNELMKVWVGTCGGSSNKKS